MKFSVMKDNVVKFFKSVATEWKKITWPTAPQLKAYTIVVILTLVVVTSFLYVTRVLTDLGFKTLNI